MHTPTSSEFQIDVGTIPASDEPRVSKKGEGRCQEVWETEVPQRSPWCALWGYGAKPRTRVCGEEPKAEQVLQKKEFWLKFL